MEPRRPSFGPFYFVVASATGIAAILVLTALAEQNLIGRTALMYAATVVIAATIVAGIGITMWLLRGRSGTSDDDGTR